MALHIFYRNSDIVKMAMQTQLCNLNESMFDTDGERFVKTPTFWVMKLFREHIEQYLLDEAFTADDAIDAVATVSEDGERVTLTAANKDLYHTATLRLCDEILDMEIVMSDIVCADDVRAVNSFDDPELIKSYPFEAALPEITIPAHSVVRLVLKKEV